MDDRCRPWERGPQARHMVKRTGPPRLQETPITPRATPCAGERPARACRFCRRFAGLRPAAGGTPALPGCSKASPRRRPRGPHGPGAAPCRSRQPRGECHPERNGRYRPPSNGQAPERHGPRLHPDGADRGHPGAPGAALTSARSPWRAGHRPHQRAPTLSSMPCAGAVSSLCRRVALTPTEKPEGLAAGARRQPRL